MEFDIKFRAFKMGDEKFINALRENEEMEQKIGGTKRFVSIDREAKWVHDIIMNDNQSAMYFAIILKNTDEMIGYLSISDIDYRNGSCFWSGIKISPNAGDGYGAQAALLVLKYIFEEMRMVRCSGICQEENVKSLNMLTKVGFKKEGIMRKHLFKNGKYLNQWILSFIDDDYLTLKIKYNL
jgi:ribosomal-protein-alanine N-acetyltransferase